MGGGQVSAPGPRQSNPLTPRRVCKRIPASRALRTCVMRNARVRVISSRASGFLMCHDALAQSALRGTTLLHDVTRQKPNDINALDTHQ